MEAAACYLCHWEKDKKHYKKTHINELSAYTVLRTDTEKSWITQQEPGALFSLGAACLGEAGRPGQKFLSELSLKLMLSN